MEWIDEAAALFAIKSLYRTKIVTAKVSELNFINPARSGDYLEFYCNISKIGRTSLTIDLEVKKKTIVQGWMGADDTIVTCQLVFVAVDDEGKSTPHGLKINN